MMYMNETGVLWWEKWSITMIPFSKSKNLRGFLSTRQISKFGKRAKNVIIRQMDDIGVILLGLILIIKNHSVK